MNFFYLRSQENKSSKGFNSPNYFVPTYRIIFVKEGRGFYRFDGQDLEVKPGMFFLTSPGNRSIDLYDGEVVLQVVSFTAPDGWLEKPFVVYKGTGRHNDFLIQIIQDLIYGKKKWKEPLLNIALDLFLDEDEVKKAGNQVILEKANYIRENPHLNFSIKDLAKQCGCSESHFRRLFKEQMDISPKQFIIKVKMQYAHQLMAEEKLYVKEVASIVGYDIYEFSKQFKNVYKKSPTQLISKVK